MYHLPVSCLAGKLGSGSWLVTRLPVWSGRLGCSAMERDVDFPGNHETGPDTQLPALPQSVAKQHKASFPAKQETGRWSWPAAWLPYSMISCGTAGQRGQRGMCGSYGSGKSWPATRLPDWSRSQTATQCSTEASQTISKLLFSWLAGKLGPLHIGMLV